MSDEHRDRSEGWKYAKISGHENEKNIKDEVFNSEILKNRILKIAHKENNKITKIDYGGINEKDVKSVIGGKTKSKSDLMIYLDNGETIGISIKKSLSGQVYLIGADRFISGYEKQFCSIIPNEVKEAINLFWGNSEKTEEIIENYGSNNKKYEEKKHRVVATTLKKYSEPLYYALIEWFNQNIENIFEFCFSKGLATDEKEWSKIIWYKNDVNQVDIDVMINIEDAKKCLKENCSYGTKTGGSTMQLPFGFVQWHSPKKKIPGSMQFHHKYSKLIEMIKDYCKEHSCDYNDNNPTLEINDLDKNK